jgi:hypothetical protein
MVSVEIVTSIYEVAGRVAGGNGRVRGLLVDPRVLLLRDLEGVRTLHKFVRMPVVMMPMVEGASPRAGEAGEYGVIAWQQAAPAIAALIGAARETAPVEAPRPEPAAVLPVPTDNRGASSAGAEAENSVTSQPARRYDELGIQPLVSAQELAALLGPK